MVIICVALLAIKRKGIAPYIRQVLMVLILFAINLRPMYISSEVKVLRQKLNCYCIIVVDDTLSMMAEDYDGDDDKVTRMDGAKADIEYITKKMTGQFQTSWAYPEMYSIAPETVLVFRSVRT